MNFSEAVIAMKRGEILIEPSSGIFYRIQGDDIECKFYLDSTWHRSSNSHRQMIHKKFEIYKEPKKIKVGDFVIVDYFNDMHRWEVIGITDTHYEIHALETYRLKTHRVFKGDCKKSAFSAFPKDEEQEPEYKVDENVWVKGKVTGESNRVKIGEGGYFVQTGEGYFMDTVYVSSSQLEPRGDDE